MGLKGRSIISAADKLRTLELYMVLGSFKKVSDALKEQYGVEIVASGVRQRLLLLNIQRNYDPRHVHSVVERLKWEVEAEKAAGIELPARSSEAEPLTPEEVIETLEAFVLTQKYSATGRLLRNLPSNADKKLRLEGGTIKSRLITILGEGNTYPVYAKKILNQLKKERDQHG